MIKNFKKIIDKTKIHIETTKDGSLTLKIPQWNETYHSTHGAVSESLHVFIKAGLEYFYKKNSPNEIIVGEAGFGTGLNALLTYQFAFKNQIKIFYETYEKYPLEQNLVQDFSSFLPDKEQEILFEMHRVEWEKKIQISPFFTLLKKQTDFREINRINFWDIHYYDAFGARVQPELWTSNVFKKIVKGLKIGGIFVTYSAKGSLKRDLKKLGMLVENLPGPPGKREMTRAIKIR